MLINDPAGMDKILFEEMEGMSDETLSTLSRMFGARQSVTKTRDFASDVAQGLANSSVQNGKRGKKSPFDLQ